MTASAVDEWWNISGNAPLEKLRCDIQNYLWGDRETFQSAQLEIQITDIGGNSHELWLTLEIHGTVNNQPFEFIDQRTINLIEEKKNTTMGSLAAAPITGLITRRAIDRESKSPPKEVRPSVLKRLVPLLKQSQSQIEDKLYAICGVTETASTQKWRRVFAAALVSAVVAGLVTFVTGVIKIKPTFVGVMTMRKPLALLSFAATLATVFGFAFIAYMFVHAIALPFMPDSFLLREPEGRRAMRTLGVSTPTAARASSIVMAVIWFAILAGAAICAVVLG